MKTCMLFLGLILSVATISLAGDLVQSPDLTANGLDVLNGPWSQGQGTGFFMKYLADDFRCNQTGPINNVHIWGSYGSDHPWEQEGMETVPLFNLAIFSDVPGVPGVTPSKPGNVLWTWYGQATVVPYATANEGFYDPNTNQIIGSDTQVWQFDFNIPQGQRFVQQQGTVYWLGMSRSADMNGDGMIDANDSSTQPQLILWI